MAFVRDALERDRQPNTTWDSAAAGRCVDWFTRAASSCDPDPPGDQPCEDLYRGTLPQGCACTSPAECAAIDGSEATCLYDFTTSTGSCAPAVQPVRGRAGEACIATCASGSCGDFGSAGSVPYTLCYLEDDLICSYGQGVCVPVPHLGEQCLEYYCEPGAYCSNLNQICAPTKPDGQMCLYDDECTQGSCADDTCGPGSVASPQLCLGVEP
jgi:hypothetical protein